MPNTYLHSCISYNKYSANALVCWQLSVMNKEMLRSPFVHYFLNSGLISAFLQIHAARCAIRIVGCDNCETSLTVLSSTNIDIWTVPVCFPATFTVYLSHVTAGMFLSSIHCVLMPCYRYVIVTLSSSQHFIALSTDWKNKTQTMNTKSQQLEKMEQVFITTI